MTSSDQIRAARALLRLDQAELARSAHISVATLRRLEAEETVHAVSSRTVAEVRRVLEERGVEFIPHGVRRRPSPDRDAAQLAGDLLAIAGESAARQAALTPFTEADLYDVNGLPR